MPWRKILKWFFTRALIAYLVAAVILFCIGSYRKVCARRLNSIAAWGDFPMEVDPRQPSRENRQLRMAIRYYKIVSELFPQNDQPDAMIGYCYALLGDTDRAIQYYQQAKAKNPKHFWRDYNLGVLHYRRGEGTKALTFFRQSVGMDAQAAVQEAVLTSLADLPMEERRMLFERARRFAFDVRELAFRTIIKIELEQKRYDAAAQMALLARNDPAVKDKALFETYAAAAYYKANHWETAMAFSKSSLTKRPDLEWPKIFLRLSLEQLEKRQLKPTDALFAKFLNDRNLFPDSIGTPVLHPWAYFIQPGKEIYLQQSTHVATNSFKK